MKKILLAGSLSIMLLLAACGSDKATTEDMMEFGSNPEFDTYINPEFKGEHLKKIATYKTDETESGNIEHEWKGLEETYAIHLVEDSAGTIGISIIGEQVNGTDEHLYADTSFEFTTDTMEQTEIYNGYGFGGELKPNTKHQGVGIAPLNYPDDIPSEITIDFPGVFKMEYEAASKSYVYYGEDYFFRPQPITLTKVE